MEYKTREYLREIDDKEFHIEKLLKKIRRYELKLDQFSMNYEDMIKRFEDELVKQKEFYLMKNLTFKDAYSSYKNVSSIIGQHLLSNKHANLMEEYSLLLDQMILKKEHGPDGGR